MYSIQQDLYKRNNAISPTFRAGDTVTVYIPMISKGKTIEKSVTGVCLRVTSSTFSIRVGVDADAIELTYSFYTPTKVEIVGYGKVRRARLYYLRNLLGKKARIKRDFGRKGIK
jgi:large subunit ribosomal protein L19